MKSFEKYLKTKGKTFKYKKALFELGIKIAMVRKEKKLTQTELSVMADVTQQQVSKIECGENCEVMTLIHVCHALGVSFTIR